MISQTYPLIASAILLPLLQLSSFAASEGINCHGDGHCKTFTSGYNGQNLLVEAVMEVNNNTIFTDGRNIACLRGMAANEIDGALCIWTWNTQNDTTGARVKEVVNQIVDHGCHQCGSAPTQPTGNDLSTGEVTIGWSTDDGGCSGVCNAYGSSDYLPGAINPNAGLASGQLPAGSK